VTLIAHAASPPKAQSSLASRGPFDIVVIDLEMGRPGALSLIGQARRHNDNVVVVCLFDRLDHGLERDLRMMGASMCLERTWVRPVLFQLLWHVQKRKLITECSECSVGTSVPRPFVEEERLN
jgi:DNA-binding response OmpR family regulator